MVREVTKDDLNGLLRLYTQLHGNKLPESSDSLEDLWESILADKNHHIIAAEENGRIVSSCVCIIVPNLTRGQRPYALIENVITDEAFRKKGFASSCLEYAANIAKSENCYKIMLMTGAKDESTLDFYRRAGFNSDDKTAFIRWL
ncbi:MAG: GNAT family N-acetyltransferase [Ruminococcus sp.]|nr:GNAT family N-acetyltransferase [Ruminococcus sp.]